ncbi:MAG: FAD-dependent oxidoreductase [Novosphingobium sp.]|nr:FAD-dependent oxidoreductase [Novosphingobium sp.]
MPNTTPADGCYWTRTAPHHPFPTHTSPIEVDVAIVGGGIVGVIAARLLKDRGQRVAVVEACGVGRGVTGRSTAKVTAQHALVLSRIEDRHGQDAARCYAEANRAGVALIAELVGRHGIACAFEPAPAVVYATSADGAERIRAEAAAARRAGLAMELSEDAGLPYSVTSALRLDGQFQFHPVHFVTGLAATIPGDGSHVFEQTRVVSWDEQGIETAQGRISAPRVIMATHLPLGQVGQFHAHNAPHMHAIIAASVAPERAPHVMAISADEPKRSVRGHVAADGAAMLIATGPTFKHGDAEEEAKAFADLEKFAVEHFGAGEPIYRWTNEDYTPRDGLPYVGWAGGAGDSPLVATGFDAWGISNGAAAATILADLATDRDNPWAGLFDASRHSAKGLGTMAAEGLEVAKDLVAGHLDSHSGKAGEIDPGGAAIVEIDGRATGIYRDPAGRAHAVSAVCTHMGCLLGWNPVDRSWDCSCHGSRFAIDGAVLHGPAIEPLAPVRIEQEEPA